MIVTPMWGFPKIVLPLNHHPFEMGIFHDKPSSYLVPPMYGNLHLFPCEKTRSWQSSPPNWQSSVAPGHPWSSSTQLSNDSADTKPGAWLTLGFMDRKKLQAPIDPKQFFSISIAASACMFVVLVCFSSSWCWQFLVHRKWEQHESQETFFHLIAIWGLCWCNCWDNNKT